MTVGDRMRNRRVELGYSQEEVAIKLGYKSRSSVNKMECSRNLPIAKVERVAEILQCSPAYLMGWEDKKSDAGSHAKARMIMDNQFVELFSYWEQLSDKGKEKLMDNASDLCQIYKKDK